MVVKDGKENSQKTNAGNIGDVFKHACLISLFESLRTNSVTPTTYIESHGGFASYPAAALRKENGVWKGQRNSSLPILVDYPWKNIGCKNLASIIKEEKIYPGSASAAFRFMPPTTEFKFCDVDKLAIRSVREEAEERQIEAISVFNSDGFEYVQKVLEAEPPGRILVFLDPWYQTKSQDKDWAQSVNLATAALSASQTLIVWYKKTLAKRPFPSDENYKQLDKLGAHWAELWFPDGKRVGKGGWCSHELKGSGLFWVNSPELDNVVEEVGVEMKKAFSGKTNNGRLLDLEFRSNL